jgi:hypothetical protein
MAASADICANRFAMIESRYLRRGDRALHMNVLSLIRRTAIVSICLASLLLAGCATDEGLTIDGRSPLAGEPTPPPEMGPRGGWAW